MDNHLNVLQPTGASAAPIWRSAEFVRATAIQQALNHVRRATEALALAPTSRKTDKLSETARALNQQRARLGAELADLGMPSLTALVVLKIDIDQRHPISVDIGMALCALGASRIARIHSEVIRSLSELRTADIATLLQACARLGWDREIDRSIASLRPGGESGHLGEALNWRIQREPWRIADHSLDWAERLRQAHQVALRLEADMLGRARAEFPSDGAAAGAPFCAPPAAPRMR